MATSTLIMRYVSSRNKKNDKKSSGPIIIGRTARKKKRGPHMGRKGRNNEDENSSNSDSYITHLINGGTPLDPAPAPFELANFGEDSLYTLVLLRHGESEWNKLNRYTGWCDVPLTPKGEIEARAAGRLLFENGIV